MSSAISALSIAVLAVIVWAIWKPLSILVIVFFIAYAVIQSEKEAKQTTSKDDDKPQ